MKQIKKLFTVVTALLLCLIPLFGNTMTVNAEGTTTYYVKYVEGSGKWYYQTNGWKDDAFNFDISILSQNIKDGDHLVLDSVGKQASITLNLNVSLSSLTFSGTDAVIVGAKSVDTFYSVNSGKGVVNAPVKNAYIYDASLTQFNDNVDYIEIISSNGDLLNATIGTNGTVNHVKAYTPNYLHYEYYSFDKGALKVENGTLKSAQGTYSTVLVEAPATPAPAPATPVAPAPSDEYDEVPKTGDTPFQPFLLVAIAALCLAGSYKLKKEM